MERVSYCPRAFGSRPAFAAHLVSPLRASNQDSLNLRFGFSWGALVAKLFRLPDGQISSCFASLPVQPLLQKYFRSRLTQIRCISKPSRPDRGAFRDRHGRGAGCGGRDSARRAMAVAGRDGPRERSASVQDDRRLSGRQSRVVLTPVAGAKLAEAKSSPTGFDEPLIRQ